MLQEVTSPDDIIYLGSTGEFNHDYFCRSDKLESIIVYVSLSDRYLLFNLDDEDMFTDYSVKNKNVCCLSCDRTYMMSKDTEDWVATRIVESNELLENCPHDLSGRDYDQSSLGLEGITKETHFEIMSNNRSNYPKNYSVICPRCQNEIKESISELYDENSSDIVSDIL